MKEGCTASSSLSAAVGTAQHSHRMALLETRQNSIDVLSGRSTQVRSLKVFDIRFIVFLNTYSHNRLETASFVVNGILAYAVSKHAQDCDYFSKRR